jgi:hypothetical protein
MVVVPPVAAWRKRFGALELPALFAVRFREAAIEGVGRDWPGKEDQGPARK